VLSGKGLLSAGTPILMVTLHPAATLAVEEIFARPPLRRLLENGGQHVGMA
jgi:hypothetical protein